MLLVVIGMGFLVGWCVELASEYLPRFAGEPPEQEPLTFSLPALWCWFTAAKEEPRPRWFKLHLAVELFSGFVFAYFWYRFGLTLQGLLLAGSYLFFATIAVIDFKYRLVLNIMMYPAIGIVLLGHISLGQAAVSTLFGGIVVLVIFLLVAVLKPGQLGSGDVKLATLIGMIFGYPQMFWALIIGAGSGAIMSILLLVSGRYRLSSRIPYAPFLCLGAMTALLHNPFAI